MVKTLPSSARDVGSIPVREAKSPHALQTKKKKKKQKTETILYNKFNEDF